MSSWAGGLFHVGPPPADLSASRTDPQSAQMAPDARRVPSAVQGSKRIPGSEVPHLRPVLCAPCPVQASSLRASGLRHKGTTLEWALLAEVGSSLGGWQPGHRAAPAGSHRTRKMGRKSLWERGWRLHTQVEVLGPERSSGSGSSLLLEASAHPVSP